MARVGINGFGRIGRLAARALRNHPSLELVHINESKGDAETAAHLFELDTVHGSYEGDVSVYGYTITDRDGDVVDSCWGFYGLECAEQEGRHVLNYWATKQGELFEAA